MSYEFSSSFESYDHLNQEDITVNFDELTREIEKYRQEQKEQDDFLSGFEWQRMPEVGLEPLSSSMSPVNLSASKDAPPFPAEEEGNTISYPVSTELATTTAGTFRPEIVDEHPSEIYLEEDDYKEGFVRPGEYAEGIASRILSVIDSEKEAVEAAQLQQQSISSFVPSNHRHGRVSHRTSSVSGYTRKGPLFGPALITYGPDVINGTNSSRGMGPELISEMDIPRPATYASHGVLACSVTELKNCGILLPQLGDLTRTVRPTNFEKYASMGSGFTVRISIMQTAEQLHSKPNKGDTFRKSHGLTPESSFEPPSPVANLLGASIMPLFDSAPVETPEKSATGEYTCGYNPATDTFHFPTYAPDEEGYLYPEFLVCDITHSDSSSALISSSPGPLPVTTPGTLQLIDWSTLSGYLLVQVYFTESDEAFPTRRLVGHAVLRLCDVLAAPTYIFDAQSSPLYGPLSRFFPSLDVSRRVAEQESARQRLFLPEKLTPSDASPSLEFSLCVELPLERVSQTAVSSAEASIRLHAALILPPSLSKVIPKHLLVHQDSAADAFFDHGPGRPPGIMPAFSGPSGEPSSLPRVLDDPFSENSLSKGKGKSRWSHGKSRLSPSPRYSNPFFHPHFERPPPVRDPDWLKAEAQRRLHKQSHELAVRKAYIHSSSRRNSRAQSATIQAGSSSRLSSGTTQATLSSRVPISTTQMTSKTRYSTSIRSSTLDSFEERKEDNNSFEKFVARKKKETEEPVPGSYATLLTAAAPSAVNFQSRFEKLQRELSEILD